MSNKVKNNVPASIRQRLFDLSKRQGRTFGEILQYYAMERFLFRLSKSKYADRFVLKGALLLAVWHSEGSRSTMDIDLLGRIENSEETIAAAIREILKQPGNDGIVYDANTIRIESITEDATYQGVRVSFEATLASARIKLRIDIGFGDTVYPPPQRQEFPVLLDQETPQLLCYSRETAIAEKFEAMVKLGKLNSRMKDFFDIWLLSRHFGFDQIVLAKALELTFTQRETDIKDAHVLFSPEFSALKQVQWEAFCGRQKLLYAPVQFSEVIDALFCFLVPCTSLAQKNEEESMIWEPPGPWKTRKKG